MPEVLKITYYIIHEDLVRMSRDEAQAASDRFHNGAQVTEKVVEYRVGDQVMVDAFGRWRQGVVTKLGRSKLTIEYVSNAGGAKRERAFHPISVRPHQ